MRKLLPDRGTSSLESHHLGAGTGSWYMDLTLSYGACVLSQLSLTPCLVLLPYWARQPKSLYPWYPHSCLPAVTGSVRLLRADPIYAGGISAVLSEAGTCALTSLLREMPMLCVIASTLALRHQLRTVLSPAAETPSIGSSLGMNCGLGAVSAAAVRALLQPGIVVTTRRRILVPKSVENNFCSTYFYKGFIREASSQLREGGIRSFYSGLGRELSLQVPTFALYLGLYDTVVQRWPASVVHSTSLHCWHVGLAFLCASLGVGVQTLLTNIHFYRTQTMVTPRPLPADLVVCLFEGCLKNNWVTWRAALVLLLYHKLAHSRRGVYIDEAGAYADDPTRKLWKMYVKFWQLPHNV
jgi:hypothetical protein